MPKKTNEPVYEKKDQISHVLERPEMYIGSPILENVEEYTVVDDEYHIQKRNINISQALIRIFIEPLSNVVDNCSRSKKNNNKTTKIKIDINDDTISFWNDGDIVPIKIHEKEKCYNHSLIFGHLLSSSNYADDEERENISGRFGIGIKAVNILSSKFTVEGSDPVNKKKLKQTWTNNMRKTSDPKVTSYSLKKGYTKITYTLDFSRFGIETYTPEIISVYKKLIVDCAMLTKVPLYFNGTKIPVSNLLDYSKLYFVRNNEEKKEEIDAEDEKDSNKEKDNDSPQEFKLIKTDDCEVVITPSLSGEFEAISFVNGIYTQKGGCHVNSWSEALFRPIVDKLNKPKKPQLNISEVKKFFRLFVVAVVKNPTFNSQSKEILKSPNVTAEVDDKDIKKILKWSIMDRLDDVLRSKELLVLKKSERKKRGYTKVEGHEPANFAGSKKSYLCNLILVEGLSAKTFASWGIQRGLFGHEGRDYNGIKALRGKVMNTRKAKAVSIEKNKVIRDIIQILGLQYGIDYSNDENYHKLSYGKVTILTDSDVDGIHITGLIQNFFHSLFPSLLSRKDFLYSMYTPIVRVFQGKNSLLFFNEQDYKKYVAEIQKKNPNKKIDKKYYKGLGSSSEQDVMEVFGVKMVAFIDDEKTYDIMNKAFADKVAGVKLSDARKQWIKLQDPNCSVVKWVEEGEEVLTIPISEYINTEFVKFSIDDCRRSIPNIMDGLKEGHRKVMYTVFSRNLPYSSNKTIKVAQLAGYVSGDTNYHHGEQNLEMTITALGAEYVGSNNLPLLYRGGCFGTREELGHDSANGRYIWTKLDMLTRLIFRKEDEPLLDYIEDDGESIEPRFYVPIIPMILVNGSVGIGTGWSTFIPNYNPEEIIAWIKDCINCMYENSDVESIDEPYDPCGGDGSGMCELKPWYRGFFGNITQSKSGYCSEGVLTSNGKKTKITEIPVNVSISEIVDKLEGLREEKKIVKYKNHSTPRKIDFEIIESPEFDCTIKSLGLTKNLPTSNMVLFTENEVIEKFKNVTDILTHFCKVRYTYYVKRKKHQLSELENNIKFLGNKKRFLEEVRDGELKLFVKVGKLKESRKTQDIVSELEERGYDKMTETKNRKDTEDVEEDTEEKVEEKVEKHKGYDYLLRLQISSITLEKIKKITKEVESLKITYDKVKNTPEKDIWLTELDELLSEYKKWLVIIEKEKVAVNKYFKKK